MIQQTEYVIAGVTPPPYGYETGGILIYDYTTPIDIYEAEIISPPEAKHGVYSPYQWLKVTSKSYCVYLNIDYETNKLTQNYLSGSAAADIGMTAILQYKIDPAKIKKINYDITINQNHPTASWTTDAYKFNLYLTDTISRDLYNYSTPQVPVLWRSELWDGNNLGQNIGSIDLTNIELSSPVYLAIGAPGWSFVINNIDFEEV